MAEAAKSGGAPSGDRRTVIEALEAQMAEIPRATRPYEHAAVAYRLGLAYAESPPSGNPADGLRRALACYEVAAGVFDPRFDPVEHARVLNAAGAAHRALGDRRKAAALFEQAAQLFEGRDRDAERAAALNNLGLTRAELGEPEQAVAALDEAVDLFDTTTPEGRRGRAATLHSRGMAAAALGTAEGLERAVADYDVARSELDPEEAPYHHALIHHSLGVACSSLANLRPDARDQLLESAIDAFDESLTLFTRKAFPFQHALAKHNLGLAHAAVGDIVNLRRALASFEDAVAVLDPRLHADAWQHAYASLSKAEEQLTDMAPGMTRAEHFAALVGGVKRPEREVRVRERMHRLLDQPEPLRAVAELALATAKLGFEQSRGVMEVELVTVIELPKEHQAVALQARFQAHRSLPSEAREEADRALDQAIGDALGGPQRVFVRDFLYSLGWERP